MLLRSADHERQQGGDLSEHGRRGQTVADGDLQIDTARTVLPDRRSGRIVEPPATIGAE